MTSLVVVQGTRVQDAAGFGQSPIQSAVGVAQTEVAQPTRNEDGRAAVVVLVVRGSASIGDLVQVHGETESQIAVGGAGPGECHINVLKEARAGLIGTIVIEHANLGTAGQGGFGGVSDARGGDERGGGKQSFLHVFPVARHMP